MRTDVKETETGTLKLSVPKKELQKEVEAPKYIEIEG